MTKLKEQVRTASEKKQAEAVKKLVHPKPLKELNLTNRFLFDQVMDDSETLRNALGIILDRELTRLTANQSEKELRLSALIRSVRLDLLASDENRTVYIAEMQGQIRPDLPKRSRYYQALLDTSLLDPGIATYNALPDSYLIMIMTFDLFGKGKYCYTFRPQCEEVPDLKLADGTTRIFLNTRGENPDEVSKELVEFLHYVETTTDEAAQASSSKRIHRIHERVCKVRSSEEIGVKYMQAWEEKIYERLEARAEGRAEGGDLRIYDLVQRKLSKGKSIEQIAADLETDTDSISRLVKSVEESGILDELNM